MIVQRQPGEVTHWLVAFYDQANRGWVQRLVPGRFKHVAAFGYSNEARTWLFVEAAIDRARICLLPDGGLAESMLAKWTVGAVVLKIEGRPVNLDAGFRLWPFCCTAMVGALLGFKGSALRPDALYRLLLRENAEIIHDGGPVRAKAASAAA